MNILALSVSALVSGLFFCPVVRADPLAENQSRIGVFSGDVQLLTSGAAQWIEPHLGVPMESGDEITTGDDGHVDLVLSEEAYWRVEPNSDVILEFAESHGGRISLVSGTLTATVDASRAPSPHWTLNTPAGLCTIHGGEFGVSFFPGKGIHLAIFQNEVEWQSAETEEGEQPVLRTPAGKEIILQRGKPVNVTTKGSPAMHVLFVGLGALHKERLKSDQIWTPWTEATRAEIRAKFIPPAPHHTHRPRPVRTRRRKGAASNAS